MFELTILILIPLAIGGLFITNVMAYETDEEIIKKYFEQNGQTILKIKNSTERLFGDKEKLDSIRAKNKVKNSIIVDNAGALLRYNFYSVCSIENSRIELLVVNSSMFFVKPKLYLDTVIPFQAEEN